MRTENKYSGMDAAEIKRIREVKKIKLRYSDEAFENVLLGGAFGNPGLLAFRRIFQYRQGEITPC